MLRRTDEPNTVSYRDGTSLKRAEVATGGLQVGETCRLMIRMATPFIAVKLE